VELREEGAKVNLPKTLIKLRCSRILSRGPSVVEGEDFIFLMTDVFPRHPEWTEKCGVGVSHVEIRKHGHFNSLGFFLVRTDGSCIDISYRVAMDGKGTVYARFCAAARAEIRPQVFSWKLDNPAPEAGMHCDHIVPFDAILKEWLASVGLESDEVRVTSQLVGHTDLFAERALAVSWQRFHLKRAAYQWLTAEDNIRKSNNNPRQLELEGCAE
jgi:hypothetical protein